jgi:hypothetical protein
MAEKVSQHPQAKLPLPIPFKLIERKKGVKKLTQVFGVKKMFDALRGRIDNLLDTEIAWNNFSLEVWDTDRSFRDRYLRLNPELYTVPKMDDIAKRDGLQQAVQDKLREAAYVSKVRQVAYRLVASSFYLELSPIPRLEDQIECAGKL